MLIEIQEQYDGVYVLRCEGSLVPGPEMDYLQTTLDEVRKLPGNRLVIDFQHVAAIGSTGLSFIVGAYRSATRRPGGRIVVTGANRYVRQVLDLTRLTPLIPLASDIASGLAVLRGEPSLCSLPFSNCCAANL